MARRKRTSASDKQHEHAHFRREGTSSTESLDLSAATTTVAPRTSPQDLPEEDQNRSNKSGVDTAVICEDLPTPLSPPSLQLLDYDCPPPTENLRDVAVPTLAQSASPTAPVDPSPSLPISVDNHGDDNNDVNDASHFVTNEFKEQQGAASSPSGGAAAPPLSAPVTSPVIVVADPVESIAGNSFATACPQNDLTDEENVFVISFRYNQDGSCFIASTTSGFRVYTCRPLSEFARREVTTAVTATNSRSSHTEAEQPRIAVSGSAVEYGVNSNTAANMAPAAEGGLSGMYPQRCTDFRVRFACMLYRSHSFALVTAAEPQKVQLWNDRERRVVGWIRLRYPVLYIAMRREIFVVVTAAATYVYRSGTVSPLHVIPTGDNPRGVVALSSIADEPWVLCCPAVTPGGVRVQRGTADSSSETQCPDSDDVGSPFVFQAHQSPIGLLALNHSGSFVASASVQGTVIRISATSDGSPLREFRLGVVPHVVRCMVFRQDDAFLAVASDSSTVHIFKISETPPVEETSSPGSGRLWSSLKLPGKDMLNSTLRSVFPKYFAPGRAFATLALQPDPSQDVRACGRNALFLHVRATDCAECRPKLRELQEDSAAASRVHQLVLDGYKRAINGGNYAYFTTTSSSSSRCQRTQVQCSSGPQVSFTGGSSNHLFIIHQNGFAYEARFDAVEGGRCCILSASPWFAPRREFSIVENDEKGANRVWPNNPEDQDEEIAT